MQFLIVVVISYFIQQGIRQKKTVSVLGHGFSEYTNTNMLPLKSYLENVA